jgi:tRNA/tmRNA/rRNA uracil-C5-methylase (TrmA/RlmC/RlmD family)
MSDIITLGGPAAGGGFVGHDEEGRVLFVRHGLPGEKVRVELTERHKRWGRADAIEIIEASPDRVSAPCEYFGAGRCGGCDYQHASVDAQRRYKADLLAEQLRRIAGIDLTIEVEAVSDEALGNRTRIRYGRSRSGALGMRRRASHDIIEISSCPLGTAAITTAMQRARDAEGSGDLELVDLANRTTIVSDDDLEAGFFPDDVTVTVGAESYVINPAGFFQIHRKAPELLVKAVLEGLNLQGSEVAADFYAGAGLFAKPMARAVGPDGAVIAIESAPQGVSACDANLAEFPWAVTVDAPVSESLVAELRDDLSHAVFDPPRQGIESGVIEALTEFSDLVRCVSVSCDAATFARDLARFIEGGFQVESIRAFDLFEMTEHAEYVAVLVRD